MESPIYREILSIFYPFYYVFTLFSQLLVIYTILRHSPKNLQTLKKILINTCLFQIIHATTCFLTQMRQVSNLTPMQLWVYGPARHFDPMIAYSIYHMLQTAAFVSSMSVFITIYMKYEAAKNITTPKGKIIKVVVLLCIPILVSVGMEVTSIISQAQSAEKQAMLRTLNSNITEHSVVGIIDLNYLPSRINLVLISAPVILLPAAGLWLRRKILRYLAAGTDRNSQQRSNQNQNFVNGLTLQAFMPLIFYLTIFIPFFYVIFTREEILAQQFIIFALPVLPTGVDPFITLYSVTPYRRQIKIWLRIDKTNTITTVTSSQIVT